MRKKFFLLPMLLAGCVATQPAGGVTEYLGVYVENLVAPQNFRDAGANLRTYIRELDLVSLANVCGFTATLEGFEGCSSLMPSGTCLIYRYRDAPDWYKKAMVELHEKAHCAGWPASHRGATNPTPELLATFL